MNDLKSYNSSLLAHSLSHISQWISDEQVLELISLALKKAIKTGTNHPVPPLYSLLLTEDLDVNNTPVGEQLAIICVFFYVAADLFDDIQDNETTHPVLLKTSPAQAINIANLLLLIAQQSLLQLEINDSLKMRLLQLFLTTAHAMSIGQFFDIFSTNRKAGDITPEAIAKNKAGAEFACFFSASALLCGEESSLYYELGECYGSLLQIFTDYFDIWVPQGNQGLSNDLLIMKNSFPLYYALQDNNLKEEVKLCIAGKNDISGHQFNIRRLLAMTQAVEKFEKYCKDCEIKFENLFQKLPKLKRIQPILEKQLTQCYNLIMALKELRVVMKQDCKITQRGIDFFTTKQMALDYIQFIDDYKDVWEMQRWGFLGQTTLKGNLFTPMLILETLLDAGQDISQELKALVRLKGSDGWHYYTNGATIPPDTDDLGQMLHLIGRSCLHQERIAFKRPLQLLTSNLESSGLCPTWLCDNEKFKREEVNKAWFGNECIAVMANLYYGLAVYDCATFETKIRKGIEYILEHFDWQISCWKGVHYKSDIYTLYLVLRLLKYMNVESSLVHFAVQSLLSQQYLDGSWNNSPQDTAFAILALHQNQQMPYVQNLKSGLIYLQDTQRYDGSWGGEDLFICPGAAGRYTYFNHQKITTAFCLRAIVQSQEELQKHLTYSNSDIATKLFSMSA